MRLGPRAVVFDIDGTLVDNMSLHAEAFAAFAQRHGLPPLTHEDRARLDGRRNSEIFPILFNRDVPRDEWLAYEAEKEGLYREISRGRLVPMTGLLRLLARLTAEAVPMALATSAPEPNVVHTLNEIGLAGAVRVTVNYKGSGKVDGSHRVWVWLFETPNIGPGSMPIAELSVEKNGDVATFDADGNQVWIAVAYDVNGVMTGNAPPASGSPIGIYSSSTGAPEGVTPGAKGAVTLTFDDSQRMP